MPKKTRHDHHHVPHFYRNVGRILLLYARSEESRWAIGLFGALLASMIAYAAIDGAFSYWQRAIYDSFQAYDLAQFRFLMVLFVGIAAINIIIVIMRAYIESLLKIFWRRFLSHHYISIWLSDVRYYLLQLMPSDTDNPDQRLSDDLFYITTNTLTLFTKIMQEVFTLVVFLGILWQISGPLSFSVGGYHVVIPGYLVFVAFFYAVLGTFISKRIMKPLLPLEVEKERREGDLRYALARIREHSESIAFLKGEATEKKTTDGFVHNLYLTTRAIIRKMVSINFWINGYMQASIIVPMLLMAPRYFGEKLTIGILMQVLSVFRSVENAFTIIVQNYPDIIDWKASLTRLITFERTMHQPLPHKNIVYQSHKEPSLVIHNLTLTTPGGGKIQHVGDKTFTPGASTLIKGPSGIGKSTFLRTLQGMWLFGEGTIDYPAARFFFLPQKPYLPLGKLKNVLTYPQGGEAFSSSMLVQVLEDVGLAHLQDRLEHEAFWPQVLSGGEQQRLGFARLLLANPSWIFLDEATSALDEPSEHALYQLIKTRFPKATCISVGHRPTLEAFHQDVWLFPHNASHNESHL